MFCKYCGKKIQDDTIFCPNCGKKLKIEEKIYTKQPCGMIPLQKNDLKMRQKEQETLDLVINYFEDVQKEANNKILAIYGDIIQKITLIGEENKCVATEHINTQLFNTAVTKLSSHMDDDTLIMVVDDALVKHNFNEGFAIGYKNLYIVKDSDKNQIYTIPFKEINTLSPNSVTNGWYINKKSNLALRYMGVVKTYDMALALELLIVKSYMASGKNLVIANEDTEVKAEKPKKKDELEKPADDAPLWEKIRYWYKIICGVALGISLIITILTTVFFEPIHSFVDSHFVNADIKESLIEYATSNPNLIGSSLYFLPNIEIVNEDEISVKALDKCDYSDIDSDTINYLYSVTVPYKIDYGFGKDKITDVTVLIQRFENIDAKFKEEYSFDIEGRVPDGLRSGIYLWWGNQDSDNNVSGYGFEIPSEYLEEVEECRFEIAQNLLDAMLNRYNTLDEDYTEYSDTSYFEYYFENVINGIIPYDEEDVDDLNMYISNRFINYLNNDTGLSNNPKYNVIFQSP